MMPTSLLSGKHMGTERAERHPHQALLQLKLRHYVCREHTDGEGGVEPQER
jgi:hypothetical protein